MDKINYAVSSRALITHVAQLPWVVFLGLGRFIKLACDYANFDGVSLMPIRIRLAWDVARRMRDQRVLMVEQPPRSETNFFEVTEYVFNHWREGFDAFKVIPSFVFLPERRSSLSKLLSFVLEQEWNKPGTLIYPPHIPLNPKVKYVNLGGRHWRESVYAEMFSFPFRLIRPTRGLLADDFWGNLSPEQFLRVLKSQGFNRINLNIRDFIAMYPEENVRKQALQVWIDDIKSIEIDGYLDITRGKALMVLDQLMELHWTGTVIITSVPGLHLGLRKQFCALEKRRLEVQGILES